MILPACWKTHCEDNLSHHTVWTAIVKDLFILTE